MVCADCYSPCSLCYLQRRISPGNITRPAKLAYSAGLVDGDKRFQVVIDHDAVFILHESRLETGTGLLMPGL
jgi:hypothetical protein